MVKKGLRQLLTGNFSRIQDILMMYCWEDDKDYTRTHDIIEHGQPKLFDFDYPFYEPTLKQEFERNFIRHFYVRRVGSETTALFKMRLEDYLILNYDKWSTLYHSLDKDLNLFHNIDLKTLRGLSQHEQHSKLVGESQSETGNRNYERDDTSSKQYSESQDETGNRNYERDDTSSRQYSESLDSTQQTQADTDSVDFSRIIEATTPDGRLELTAQDGVGMVEYANAISENRATNDTGTTSSSTTGRETAGNETNTLNRDDVESTTKERNTSGNETNTLNRDDVENTTKERERELDETGDRALTQQVDEHQFGKSNAKSYTELYQEFIKGFEGIQKAMFKDMSYLFYGLFD